MDSLRPYAPPLFKGLKGYEFSSVTPEGAVRFIRGRGELKYDAENRPTHMAGTAQDITERKRADEELRKLNLELEQGVAQRTAKLEAKNTALERLNKVFVGRELRMIELKERIKELEGRVTKER